MYPFGYGLSYSEFVNYGLEVQKNESDISVSVWLENKSETPGFEGVQCYIKGTAGTGACSVGRLAISVRCGWKDGREKKIVFEWGRKWVGIV